MKTIIQLSDLHFGSNDLQITEQLASLVQELNPEILVVSGDLTTRARTIEFEQAQNFLETLPGYKIVVPGNHDISLYNIFRRFFKPHDRFTKFISPKTESFYINDEVAIIALNSSRSFTIKGGKISQKQIEKAREFISNIPKHLVKIVVTHHPVREMSHRLFEDLFNLGAQVLVSGHMHVSSVKVENNQIIVVQAGTSTSVRYREEPNSFNCLLIDGQNIAIRIYTWKSSEIGFELVDEQKFNLAEFAQPKQ